MIIENFLKKYWYKITSRQNYEKYKNTKSNKKDVEIFEKKFETYINEIQKKINTKKELSFLHSGHIGDVINVLPVIKELSKKYKCDLYLGVNKPMDKAGNIYLDEKIFKMLLPLINTQKFINKIEVYKNQDIDINFDIIRELPINLLFDNSRYGFHIAGVQTKSDEVFLDVKPHNEITDKIVIQRSLKYQNHFINYRFLNSFDDVFFIGTKNEYKDLNKQIKNLKFYNCKDFLEMAMIIKSSRLFIGNSSLGFTIAEALKIPRLLESSPHFPAAQVHGKNAYDFYFQVHFEKFFKFLNKR